MGLEWLIFPHTFRTFRDEYWSRAVLRIGRDNPSYYADLFSEADLEETLFAASHVNRAVEELTEGENARATQGHAGALNAFHAGRSLRITGIHLFSRKLAKLSRDLEQLFSTPVNINLYLSPASGKKALSRHFDTHDVFVMQLFGRKGWRLYGPPVASPLEFLPLLARESLREMKQYRLKTETRIREDVPSQLAEEFVLDPGDFLYLPRGFWHEAETEPGGISCHATVGILPTTYSDLLTLALAKAATSEPKLREQLPIGFATHADARDEVTFAVSGILSRLQHKVDAPAALSELANIFYRDRRNSVENTLLRPVQPSELESVRPESWVHEREALILGVDENLTPPQFVFGLDRFQIEASFVEACRFMCLQQSFTPAMLPGDLTADQKVLLVKQLIAENALLLSEEKKRQTKSGALRESLSGWVPCDLRVEEARVEWVLLDKEGLKEPFFEQTVRRRRLENPTAIRQTDLDALLQLHQDLPPAGFIFHVSRCGSTLLANGMRASQDSIVVSEPQPISDALASSEESAQNGQVPLRTRLLQALMAAYGQKRNPREHSLVVKFTSWNLLYIAEIRKLWPKVPCVILIRDPLEVAVSCLAKPPGWLRLNFESASKSRASKIFIRDEVIRTPEAICAHVLRKFLQIAAIQADALCRVLDYEDLDAATIARTAQFFNIPLSLDNNSAALKATLSVYSKDPLAARPFRSDSEHKLASASEELRHEVERWAAPPYREIRRTVLPNKSFAFSSEAASV